MRFPRWGWSLDFPCFLVSKRSDPLLGMNSTTYLHRCPSNLPAGPVLSIARCEEPSIWFVAPTLEDSPAASLHLWLSPAPSQQFCAKYVRTPGLRGLSPW